MQKQYRLLGLDVYNFGCFAEPSKITFNEESNAMFIFGQANGGKTTLARVFNLLHLMSTTARLNNQFLANWNNEEVITSIKVKFQAIGVRSDWVYSFEVGLRKSGIAFEILKVCKSNLSPKFRTVYHRSQYGHGTSVECDNEYKSSITAWDVDGERSFINSAMFESKCENLEELFDLYKFLNSIKVTSKVSEASYQQSHGGFLAVNIRQLWGLNPDLADVFPHLYSRAGTELSWDELSDTDKKIYTILSEASHVYDNNSLPVIEISLKGLSYEEGRGILNILASHTGNRDIVFITDYSPAFAKFRKGQHRFLKPTRNGEVRLSMTGKIYFGKQI